MGKHVDVEREGLEPTRSMPFEEKAARLITAALHEQGIHGRVMRVKRVDGGVSVLVRRVDMMTPIGPDYPLDDELMVTIHFGGNRGKVSDVERRN